MLQIVMAFAPLVFLILYALKTRKMADAMVLATLLICMAGCVIQPIMNLPIEL